LFNIYEKIKKKSFFCIIIVHIYEINGIANIVDYT